MQQFYGLINRLIDMNVTNGLIEEMDRTYMRNRLLALFNEEDYDVTPSTSGDLYETLDALATLAIHKGLLADTMASRDIFTSHLMNLFLDKPSQINHKFNAYYEESPEKATNYFYQLSQMTNYIKVNRIAHNKHYLSPSKYGDIELTINLSKPEKDPKQIALEKLAPPTHYPNCLLCVEHEGYEGTVKLPDRANHRLMRLALNDTPWMLQYSPYLYYNEHCIILSTEHRPMRITSETFRNLLAFTERFPHYFIGSNADLPIVGGSILSHEHYQGGRHTFPMDHAKQLFEFSIARYPNIKASALDWPLSTIELRSTCTDSLVRCGSEILERWKNYSDPACELLAFTDDTPHNTITPICKRDGEDYILRLVLRNNRTNDVHPLGIFHPHADVHHIKKENIGLIEVMGLAILPGRLLDELELIKAYILGEEVNIPTYHQPWADMLKQNFDTTCDLEAYIIEALTAKFVRVLEDSGVYKLDAAGIQGFKRFINTL